jgi:hypothetical protein
MPVFYKSRDNTLHLYWSAQEVRPTDRSECDVEGQVGCDAGNEHFVLRPKKNHFQVSKTPSIKK